MLNLSTTKTYVRILCSVLRVTFEIVEVLLVFFSIDPLADFLVFHMFETDMRSNVTKIVVERKLYV